MLLDAESPGRGPRGNINNTCNSVRMQHDATTTTTTQRQRRTMSLNQFSMSSYRFPRPARVNLCTKYLQPPQYLNDRQRRQKKGQEKSTDGLRRAETRLVFSIAWPGGTSSCNCGSSAPQKVFRRPRPSPRARSNGQRAQEPAINGQRPTTKLAKCRCGHKFN